MRPENAGTDDLLIRLDGIFDTPAARHVEATLAQAHPDAYLRLDLTQIREFHDFAIAVLAHALTSNPARVALRGLRHHQIRMLRYFGVDAALFERAAVTDGT